MLDVDMDDETCMRVESAGIEAGIGIAGSAGIAGIEA